MIQTASIAEWEQGISNALTQVVGPLQRVTVLEETRSTQTAARDLGAKAGDVIVAWRQTEGRGRLGRLWADTGEEGVAMTAIVPRDRSERLAVAAAVAVCLAMERLCRDRVRVMIKWPNDIIVNGRKLAGILVEQVADCALIGIGINVHQSDWPDDLSDRAVSLGQLGVQADRLQVMVYTLIGMQLSLQMNDRRLVEQYGQRDGLAGRVAAFRNGQREVRGKVLRVDPMRGLAVLTEDQGEVWLPAATTTVVKE